MANAPAHIAGSRVAASIWSILAALFLAGSLSLSSPSAAQSDGEGTMERTDQDPALELDERRARTADELDLLSQEITLSQDRLEALQLEVEGLRRDEAAVREAMIESADSQRRLSRDIAALEGRYTGLREDEANLLASLSDQREVLGEVLAGLQRLGRNPPPALLVTVDDALASVRSAILLGSMVPEMRTETERLLADLDQLATIRASIETDRSVLTETLQAEALENRRLALLLDEKRSLQAEGERQLQEERAATARLAERATGLEDLIASLEDEIASVREAAEQARLATQLRERQTDEQLERAREMSRRGEQDINRISPAVAFDALRESLRMPVEGAISRQFGDDDGTGHSLQGIMVSSRSGAIVQSPADGWVVYSGPFRSYGQLLIVNAGDEYHIVMAGMDRIDVAPGQFVLAGEPVAAMGETRLAGAAALALASSQPTLYIEFRKDGRPVDSNPWWARETLGRAHNDS